MLVTAGVPVRSLSANNSSIRYHCSKDTVLLLAPLQLLLRAKQSPFHRKCCPLQDRELSRDRLRLCRSRCNPREQQRSAVSSLQEASIGKTGILDRRSIEIRGAFGSLASIIPVASLVKIGPPTLPIVPPPEIVLSVDRVSKSENCATRQVHVPVAMQRYVACNNELATNEVDVAGIGECRSLAEGTYVQLRSVVGGNRTVVKASCCHRKGAGSGDKKRCMLI